MPNIFWNFLPSWNELIYVRTLMRLNKLKTKEAEIASSHLQIPIRT